MTTRLLIFAGILAAAFTVSASEADLFTREFSALADTYVFQNEPDTNFGKVATAWIKTYSIYHRELFIRFDLPPASIQNYQVESAHVRLFRYVQGGGEGPIVPFTVCTLDDTAWDEYTVTWNNPPAGITLPSISNPRPDTIIAENVTVPAPHTSYVDIDVTTTLRAAHATGRDTFSIHVYASTESSLDQYFITREGSSTYRPKLHVTLTDRPAGLTARWLDDSSVALEWTPYTLNPDSYIVQRAPTADGPYATIATTSGTTHTDATAILADGNAYYRVIAIRAADSFASPPSAVAIPTRPAQTVTASASGFIKNNSAANTPYASTDILELRNSANGDAREAFIRFDTADMRFTDTAILDLNYASKLNDGDITFTVNTMDETTPPWAQGTLTWTWMLNAGLTLPTDTARPDTELARFSTVALANNTHLLTDIADTLAALANTGQPLNIHLVSITPGVSGNHMARISSTRAIDANRPAIRYTTAPFPQNLHAIPSNDLITLHWDDLGPGITGVLQRARASTGEWQTIAETAATSHSDTSVINGVTYAYRLAKRAPDGYTGAFSESVEASPVIVTTLAPAADTFINSDDGANTNYGTSNELQIKATEQLNAKREAFLRFDLPGRQPIHSAILTLTSLERDSDLTNTILVFEALPSYTHWAETSLTWNTFLADGFTLPSADAPAPQGVLIGRRQATIINLGDTLTIDVTAAAQAAQTASAPLIIHIYSETPGNSKRVRLASKEHTSRPGPTLTLSCQSSPQGTIIQLR